MPIHKSSRKLWRKDPSGFLLPDGTESHLSENSSDAFLKIKEKAIRLESIFDQNNVLIPLTSDLAKLVSAVKDLSDSWLTKRAEDIPMTLLFQAAHFDRIAEAVVSLDGITGKSHFFKKLTSGSLDFLKRKPSHAKDILWELELWALLQKRGFKASLEEPDIIVEFNDAIIALPCKKLYSLKGASKVLSNAVAQIEKRYDFGIVALNLDDTIPPDQILSVPNFKLLGDFVNKINVDFIKKNERHFRKYLSNGRLISAMVSTNLLADVYEEKVRFNNSRQSTIWTIPGLSQQKNEQLQNFRKQLMQ